MAHIVTWCNRSSAQVIRIGDSPVFNVDTTAAGDGKLEAQVVSPTGKV